jgi:hypothetical protein
MKKHYIAMTGSWSGYGYASPINRDRAKRLMRYATGIEHHPGYGIAVHLSVCPKEGRFALEHGAAPEHRLLIWK